MYAANHARRKREAQLAAKRLRSRTCPRRFGRYGACGAVLESSTVAGRLVVTCPACERFARGICRDCPRPVAKRRARRCAACQARALRDSLRKYAENNRELVQRRARDYGRKHRTERAEYKRVWRAANPDKVREQKARSVRRAEYFREYREKHRVRLANAARAKRQGVQQLRTCVACHRIVVTHRKRKCTRCKEAARRTAQQLLAGRAA